MVCLVFFKALRMNMRLSDRTARFAEGQPSMIGSHCSILDAQAPCGNWRLTDLNQPSRCLGG